MSVWTHVAAVFRVDGLSDMDMYGPRINGPRYRAIGNSMAVPCMAWIGRRLQEVDALIGIKKKRTG